MNYRLDEHVGRLSVLHLEALFYFWSQSAQSRRRDEDWAQWPEINMTRIASNIFLREPKNKPGTAAAGWQIRRVELFQVGVKYKLFSTENVLVHRILRQRRGGEDLESTPKLDDGEGVAVISFPCSCAGATRFPITVKLVDSGIHETHWNYSSANEWHLAHHKTPFYLNPVQVELSRRLIDWDFQRMTTIPAQAMIPERENIQWQGKCLVDVRGQNEQTGWR